MRWIFLKTLSLISKKNERNDNWYSDCIIEKIQKHNTSNNDIDEIISQIDMFR